MKTVFKRIIVSVLSLIIGLSTLVYTTGIIGAEENQAANNDALEVSKTATKNPDGTYTIDLQAYTTGDVSVITKSLPTDVVLVLDQSGSMNEKITPDWKYHIESTEPSSAKEYFLKTSNNTYEPIYYVSTKIESIAFYTITTYEWRTESGRPIIRKYHSRNGEMDKDPNNEFYYRYDDPENKTSIKINILKNAVSNFIQNMQDDGGDHRVAFVGFADGETKDYDNTELLVGHQGYKYNDPEIKHQYVNAFQSVKSEIGLRNIRNSISSIYANAIGATRADLGMEIAGQVIASDPMKNDKERNKVVIMFTDGRPTSSNVFDNDVANDTIRFANDMKNQKVTVFTAGVEEVLDNTQDPSNPLTHDLNRYMQYVSSNFPNATSLTNGGEGDYTANKFLFATDEASFLQIFDEINQEITSSKTTLDEKTQLVDYISDSFLLAKDKSIEVYTQDYLGKGADGSLQWGNEQPFNAIVDLDEKNQKVVVSGFNYKDNFIVDSAPPTGKKLVVRLTAKVKDGFIGGDIVPTNKVESGIYIEDGTVVKPFPVPTTDIELKYDIAGTAASLYLGSELALPTEMIDIQPDEPGFQFSQDSNIYTIDGINNQFVNITYEIKDKNEVVGVYTIPAGHTTGFWQKELDLIKVTEDKYLNIEATVEDVVTTNSIKPQASVLISVFKPIISLSGDIIFLGENVDLNSKVAVDSWKASDVNTPTPKGPVPTLTYEYKDTASGIQPTTSKVYEVSKVLNGNVDIINGTTFNGALNIQVVEGQLDITKTIDQQSTKVESNNTLQTFVFRVDRRDTETGDIVETFYQTIDFSANQDITSKTITITGLQKGYYTVTEDQDWSWKYKEIADQRLDNFAGNGTTSASTENSNLFIGQKLNEANALYYGSKNITMINNKDHSYPAKTNFFGQRETSNILGDSANAINQFNGKVN